MALKITMARMTFLPKNCSLHHRDLANTHKIRSSSYQSTQLGPLGGEWQLKCLIIELRTSRLWKITMSSRMTFTNKMFIITRKKKASETWNNTNPHPDGPLGEWATQGPIIDLRTWPWKLQKLRKITMTFTY
jgi:hypothetical protein